MKKILLIVTLLACTFITSSCVSPNTNKTFSSPTPIVFGSGTEELPTYIRSQWLTWTDVTIASNALDYINTEWFPFGQTTRWANKVEVTTEDLYCFQRVPPKWITYIGISRSNQTYFVTNFSPIVKSASEVTIKVEVEE